jgi:NUMOD1 domain
MRKPRPHYKPSQLQRDIVSKTQKGRIVSLETREKISKGLSLTIYVYDSMHKTLLYTFPSITLAKKKLHISTRTIHKYMHKNMAYKGFLFFKSKI